MPSYQVERTIEINATPEAVFERIRNFKEWPQWSPWLAAEPDCDLTFEEEDSGYSWKGKIIGSGKIKVAREVPNQSIDLDLEFFTPHRAEAAVQFVLTPTESGTTTTWSMAGKLPFFLFWMKPMITTFIGMDYENGLKLLKDLAETGSVPFQLHFAGLRDFPAQRLLSISGSSSIDSDDLGATIGNAFERLIAALDNAGVTPEGPPMTRYNEFKPMKKLCSFTIGFPISGDLPPNLPPDVTITEQVATKAYVVEHTGPYRHLGTAWSAAMQRAKSKQFPYNKKLPPFEVNVNDPRSTPENELVTHIYLPAK